MCLKPIHSKLKVAKNNMEVFKVLRNNLKSPYEDFQYKLGKIVTVKTRLGGDKTLKEVSKGLHSCVNVGRAESIRHAGWSKDREIYKAIIPKGSIYKLGDEDDIVSNKLKIVSLYVK